MLGLDSPGRVVSQTTFRRPFLPKQVTELCLVGALLEKDDKEATPFTEDELRRALAWGRATAPGDDGVTFCATAPSESAW